MGMRLGIIVSGLGLSLLLGGCGIIDFATTEKERKEDKKLPDYVPVQEYTGQGFRLRNHNDEVDSFAEEHKKEITAAVKQFMRDHYHTDVVVHNFAGAHEYVSVFFESVGELKYYSYVNVPVDLNQEIIFLDNIDSLEGVIEISITSAIYHRIYEEEFKKLDEYLNQAVKDHGLVGIRKEALQHFSARGYATPLYFVSTVGKDMDIIFDSYMDRKGDNIEELIDKIDKDALKDVSAGIGASFFLWKIQTLGQVKMHSTKSCKILDK